MTAPLLSVEGLSVSYQTARGPLKALDDVSFVIGEGRALGLVGESGSGKSTVALTLLDLLGPGATVEAKSIRFDGTDWSGQAGEARRRLRGDKISIVFQDPSSALNPALPVGLQVSEPLIQHRNLSRAAAHARAVELLAEVGIPRPAAVADAYPHQLSGGMKQRALIATALACEPKLLLLDEPTTALDVTIEAQILDLLEKLRADHGLSLLFVSHNLGVVDRLCDDVCVLYAGRVVEQGSTGEVFARPRHPYTKGLLASLPRPDTARVERLSPIPGRFPDLTQPHPGCIFMPRCLFAEARCAEPQPLQLRENGRTARCWKTDAILDLPWVVEEDETSAPAARHASRHETLVETVAVEKRFTLGGFLSSLTLDWSSGFPFKSRPVIVRAVDGVSLRVNRGEALGLVGESGCGKSTLGRCIIRLIEPDGGDIVIDGREIAHADAKELKPIRRTAQIVFQNPDSSLNPRMTVRGMLKRPLELFGLAAGKEADKEVDRLLELVRLGPAYAARYPHQLSGGEKQRVGIARALATRPDFIVCDEAVSALDVSVQAAVLNLLADLRDRLGLAYLFISHDLSVIAHLANRVAVMYRGVIVEEGGIDEVLQPPYHPYTEALLSAIPIVGSKGRAAQRIRLQGDVVTDTGQITGCRFAHRCPRKIGPICDREQPMLENAGPDHRIACHIPFDELRAMQAGFEPLASPRQAPIITPTPAS